MMMMMRNQKKQHQERTTATSRYKYYQEHECKSNKQNNSSRFIRNQDDCGFVAEQTHHKSQNNTLYKKQISTTTTRSASLIRQTKIRNHHHHLANFLFFLVPLLSLFILNFFIFTNQSVNCVAVHEVRFIESKSGRTDYALTSETIELSCHHLMKDHLEDVKQLIWSKDGQNFIRWRKGEPGLKIIGYTFKGHIDNASTNHHIIIHNVTIEMHGKYKCSIRTDLGLDENERNIVIIQQPQCKLGGWRFKAEPTQCRETLALDCRQMFPKPEPSCSLWNGKLDRTIMGLNVDISEELNSSSSNGTNNLVPPSSSSSSTKRQKTYRVKYVQKFDLLSAQRQTRLAITNSSSSSNASVMMKPISPEYLLQFAGNLWFKCDIVVPETSWKLSLVLKLFDYNDACLEDPIEAIARWRSNYSQYIANQIKQKAQQQQQQSAAFEHQKHHQLDDFELLSSPVSNDLKYELIFPQKNNLGITKYKQAELNCWKKPKLGSLAKLSCINKFQLTQQVRLKGVNLLKCGPSGWFPVRGGGSTFSSASNGRVNANSRPRNGREILKQPYSSNTTAKATTTILTLLNNSDSSLEGKIPQKNVSTMMTDPASIKAAAVTYIQDMDSNDLDDNNNNNNNYDDNAVEISPATTATATTNHQDDDDDDDGDGDESSSVVIIPAFRNGALGASNEQDDIVLDGGVYRSQQKHLSNLVLLDHVDPLLSNMQPSEVGTLLPTCISPRARLHQQLQRPLLHDDNQHNLRILESSAVTKNDRNQPKQPSSNGTTDDTGFGIDLNSIFNFSFSSSSASTISESYHCGYCDIRMIIMSCFRCCCCLTAALFFINTMIINVAL